MRLSALVLALSLGVAGSALAQEQTPPDWDGQTLGSPHRGGTLRLTADGPGGTLDPQVNYGTQYMQVFVNMYDPLLTFRQARGPSGLDVVPDLAEAMPTISPDGLTWTLHLRSGLKFSDGSPVRVEDVVASFRRIYRVGSPTAASFYGGIVGAKECLDAPDHCTLPGVEGHPDGTIVFHLTHQDGEFLYKLAFPHAVILPAGISSHDLGNATAPGTGPYRITHYDPEHGLSLERNAYFHVWNPQAQTDGFVDHIEYSFGLSDEAQITAVEQGQYDWMLDAKPSDRLGELGAKYTSQVHIEPLLGLYYLAMNVHEKPFTDQRVRQAVSLAVNRHAMTILFGGSAISEPLCQMVPHGIPGADLGLSCPQNLEEAQRLVREAGAEGQAVTLVVPNRAIELGMGTYLRNVLQQIGLKAQLRPITAGLADSYEQNTANHVQIALAYWFADYPSASTFLDDLFGCDNYHPNSAISPNFTGFCDQHVQSLFEQAKAQTDPAKAAPIWQEAGHEIMRQMPGAPMIQMKTIDFVSKRLGNYYSTLLNHMLFSHIWVK
ncbi:peptide ABC transporter substrate-binding protein [Gluconobacter japonicus]|uniref:ABC transporter substrate-binding protein n=1 Tax=Gluconobacter japonicus TaxID=376620 RepID=A0A9Q2IPC2_GLUJA|nr:ABC transporter substrate-binding protein [Gluconobacter japonicus]KXV42085.1 peptide ABC transporter substrate-binding protein [Gluconobacter japonicus]MBF0869760.1 ABC transporter substrate-binding protein [Gluconobacter japonicus]